MPFVTHQVSMLASVNLAWPELVLLAIGALFGLLGTWIEPLLSEAFRRIRLRRRRLMSLEQQEVPSSTEGEVQVQQREDWNETLVNLARDPIRGPRIYVSTIEASDFRCFDRMEVALRHPGDTSKLDHPNVNLVIGDNGSGKSTLLKAIAIAALGPVLDSSGFVPYHLIRTGAGGARVHADFIVDDPSDGPGRLAGEVQLNRTGDYEELLARHDRQGWAEIFDESNPAFLVVGYGVNRRIAEEEREHASLERSRRRRRYQRIASLFDESAVLTPLSTWMPTLSRRRRNEVKELLDTLLPPEARLTDSHEGEAVFLFRGEDIPYPALSDGYKSFIGWVGDLLLQIDSAGDPGMPLDEVGGIVLVDEVDLLLHPSWQREVVPGIARTFPKLQFVFTTHSPIVAGTLDSGNILVARSDERGGSHLDRVDASIHGLNAEQILLSSYFELESTRAPDAQAGLGKLAEQAMEGDDEAAMRYLRTLAGESRKGETR